MIGFKKRYAVKRETISSTGRNIDVLVVRPTRDGKFERGTPGVLWIHGGGYALGMAGMVFISRAMNLVKKYGAVVVSPAYRLAGEAAYPAALEDCYSALKFLKEHADELGIDSGRIMVGGESAGGGLAAALCMLARDRGEVNVAFQMPLYPMLDDRDTDSSRDNHAPIWNTRRNHWGWKKYLGGLWGKDVPAYAAPARQTDYAGLPPAYTFVGTGEPFYCETLTYIENLKKAGIEASADVYPTAVHAFDLLLPFLRMSRQAIAAFEKRYVYAAENYSAAQKR